MLAPMRWLCNAHVLLVVFGGRPAREEVGAPRAYACAGSGRSTLISPTHIGRWRKCLMALIETGPAAGREFQHALALDPGIRTLGTYTRSPCLRSDGSRSDGAI